MICPNCGSNVSDKRTSCDRCGSDLKVYRKIIQTSNFYYNSGLAKAKVHDLSGAANALRKSLELNKKHTNARNLLGLTYFAMGETVAALSEWVISKHYQPNNNDADGYIQKVQSSPTKLDTLSQAIKRYNSALTFAKQGSEDLAIIQLKKVVTLNPSFVRAYQLLALLHMKLGENEKAKRYLGKASKIDVSNTTTLRYMQEIESASKENDNSTESEQKINTPVIPISSYREDKPNIMAYINLVIGVMIGLAFMAIFGQYFKHTEDNSGQKPNTNYDYMLQSKDEEINNLTDENKKLQEKADQLQKQLDEAKGTGDVATYYDSLIAISSQYITELGKSKSNQNFTAIADSLAEIDESKVTGEGAKSLLTNLKQEIYPDIASDYYHQAHVKYGSKKYDEALPLFLKAMQFDSKDADAVYFVARCYDFKNDDTNAALYYNKVITDFPDSKRVSSAKQLLKKITG